MLSLAQISPSLSNLRSLSEIAKLTGGVNIEIAQLSERLTWVVFVKNCSHGHRNLPEGLEIITTILLHTYTYQVEKQAQPVFQRK